MRLFIAAHFPEAANLRFLEFNDILRKNARGNFTKPQNLHMTLIFLGDTKPELVGEIKEIMKKTISNEPVNMKFMEIGRFNRGNESLVWAGGASAELSEIHRLLSAAFQNAGIETDRKKFVPHVTLGRRVQFKKSTDFEKKTGFEKQISFEKPSDFEKQSDEFPASIDADFKTPVSRISLMESELTPSGPIYKELFSIYLL